MCVYANLRHIDNGVADKGLSCLDSGACCLSLFHACFPVDSMSVAGTLLIY